MRRLLLTENITADGCWAQVLASVLAADQEIAGGLAATCGLRCQFQSEDDIELRRDRPLLRVPADHHDVDVQLELFEQLGID